MKNSKWLTECPGLRESICAKLQEYTSILETWKGKETTGLTKFQREVAEETLNAYSVKIQNVLGFLNAIGIYPYQNKEGEWFIPTEYDIEWWQIKHDEIVCGEEEVERYESI